MQKSQTWIQLTLLSLLIAATAYSKLIQHHDMLSFIFLLVPQIVTKFM